MPQGLTVDGGTLPSVMWVLIFGGIALVGLVMVVAYGVWLVHKAADLMSEVRVLVDRGNQLVELLGQIELRELETAETAGPDEAPVAPKRDLARAT